MRQAAIAIEMSRLQTTLAAAGYSPTLVLQGSYSGNGMELNPGSWEKSATINLILSGNLYNGFSTQSKVKSAKETQEQAVILEAKTARPNSAGCRASPAKLQDKLRDNPGLPGQY